ncbi:hypothetical protein Hamer_G008033, partial [Homarus americanus]
SNDRCFLLLQSKRNSGYAEGSSQFVVLSHADLEELESELEWRTTATRQCQIHTKVMLLCKQQSSLVEAVGKADEVKFLCACLLIEAFQQTRIFKGLSAFVPHKVLKQTEHVSFIDLPLPHNQSKKDIIDQQYRKVLHLSWAEESFFYDKIPPDSDSFWFGMLQYKNSTGKWPLEE